MQTSKNIVHVLLKRIKESSCERTKKDENNKEIEQTDRKDIKFVFSFGFFMTEEQTIELKVKLMEGADFMLKVKLSDSVRSLKEKIQEMCSMPVEQQRIIFRGRILENESTLRECNLEDQDTVFLVKQTVSY